MALKVAVLGAGTYARTGYLPLLKSFGDKVQVVTLWSRTLKTAEDTFAASVYAEDNTVALDYGEEGLEKILSDANIDATVNLLPTHVALQVSKRCWKAGKHVLQTKPVARTVQEAVDCLTEYRSRPRPIWYIAENYRFEEVFIKAKTQKERIGKVITVNMFVSMPMDEKNKYFHSPWRRNEDQCPGGFLCNCGVHLVAALRLVARDFDCGEVEVISGQTLNVVPEKLPPMDTASSWLRFANGVTGTLSITFAAKKPGLLLSIYGTDAAMDIQRLFPMGYSLTVRDSKGELEAIKTDKFTGVQGELTQFISSIKMAKEGTEDKSEGALKAQPEEGIRDLAVIEALCQSSQNSGQPTPVEQILTSHSSSRDLRLSL